MSKEIEQVWQFAEHSKTINTNEAEYRALISDLVLPGDNLHIALCMNTLCEVAYARTNGRITESFTQLNIWHSVAPDLALSTFWHFLFPSVNGYDLGDHVKPYGEWSDVKDFAELYPDNHQMIKFGLLMLNQQIAEDLEKDEYSLAAHAALALPEHLVTIAEKACKKHYPFLFSNGETYRDVIKLASCCPKLKPFLSKLSSKYYSSSSSSSSSSGCIHGCTSGGYVSIKEDEEEVISSDAESWNCVSPRSQMGYRAIQNNVLEHFGISP